MPPYLKKIITHSNTTPAAWEKLSFTPQKGWVLAIEEAKKEETRQRRIENLLTLLRQGKKQ